MHPDKPCFSFGILRIYDKNSRKFADMLKLREENARQTYKHSYEGKAVLRIVSHHDIISRAFRMISKIHNMLSGDMGNVFLEQRS